MSTASLQQKASQSQTPGPAIIRRFAWKEYRMLRGLWLAVAVMAMLTMWAIGALTPPQFDFAMLYFSTALGAAALYAVGAAATIFSVEHEDETYAFLNGLPTEWWPLYAGKLLLVTVSAVALAAALSIVGWFACGFDTPGGHDTPAALGLFGVGIVEMLAWGTLFSLLTKRPLTAAVLTLVVGVTATHLAVNLLSPGNTASFSPDAYINAVPLRLAIAAIVLAWSAGLARRWLVTGVRPARGGVNWAGRLSALTSEVARPIKWMKLGDATGSRGRMMARLLWQSWRESWRRLLAPLAVAFVLFLVMSLIGYLVSTTEASALLTASTIFFAPAVYGALAFSADQHRGSYRFLAEHAARPRYVWLARHIVWLGALVVATLVIAGIIIALIATGLRFSTARTVENYFQWGQWVYPTAQQMAIELQQGVNFGIRAAGLGVWGILTAYGIGQMCSMLMRSEIIAAFLAAALSIVLVAWVAVLFAWQLAGWMFLLPLFVGLMLATWLRAPAWIDERRTWRSWFWPAVAIAAPLFLIGSMLPGVRLAQVPKVFRRTDEGRNVVYAQPAIAAAIDAYRQGDTAEARETADMYVKAADVFNAWKESDLLDRWSKPEYYEAVGASFVKSAEDEEHFGIDISKIPLNEIDEFRAEARKYKDLQHKSADAARQIVMEASERLSCRFTFDLTQAQLVPGRWRRELDLSTIPNYSRVTQLLALLLHNAEPENKIPSLLAALWMSAQVRSGQPSPIVVSQVSFEHETLSQIGDWALQDGRTKEELRDAMSKLEGFFTASAIDPSTTLVADHLLVRDVLVGDIYPLALSEGTNQKPAYFAYLANRLGCERERGLRALSLITLERISNSNSLIRDLANQELHGRGGTWHVRRWLQPYDSAENWPARWMIAWPAAATSYLTRYEYLARNEAYDLNRAICDAEVFRRAALIELALAMYRLDHKSYPATLAALAPDYLQSEPLDPYSGQPFQYRPAGLNLAMKYRHHYLPYHLSGDVEPDTPLFWSVGGGNARLVRQMSKELSGDENIPEDERQQIEEVYYSLASDDPPWWNDPVLVFPLPK